MKRIFALFLALCMMCGTFAGCGNGDQGETEHTTSMTATKELKQYPINAETFFDNISTIGEAPETIYSTTAEENGLGDKIYKFTGTVEKVVTEEESEVSFGYIIVDTGVGEVAIFSTVSELLNTASEEGLALDEEKLRSFFVMPTVGDHVCIYAQYLGFSSVLQYATALYGGEDYVVYAIEGARETTTETTTATTTEVVTESTAPTTVATMGQKNALAQAKQYLSFTAFSYSGLIEQLEYEGYSNDEATYGADNCGADWDEQAAKKAQDYIDITAFSRSGLIDQLLYEGFTQEQAEYGVTAVGY